MQTSSNAPDTKIAPDALYPIVIALFVASGFSSLIYQVVWTRMLVFVFGSTTFASATVLAVFMGGLALGSYLAGRVSDKVKAPFLWYGVLEAVIGLWAVAAPFMFESAVPLYRIMWQHFHLSVLPFSLMRFCVAAAILLVPTTCMGATLPLLSRFVTRSLSYVGERVGLLYSVNTLGAVGGALTAGFLLLPNLGLHATTYLSAAINILLFVVVLVVHRLSAKAQISEQSSIQACDDNVSTTADLPVESAVKLSMPVIVAMSAFACSGAIAMIYEVAWTRTLLMVIGSSTYAFTVMLATFLIGIFVGSLVMSQFADRLKEPLAWFAAIQLILCLGSLLSIWLFNYVPYWNLSINAAFLHNPGAALAVRFLLAALMLLPITLCLGAIFPVVVRTCTTDLESVGRSVGTLYSANTVGAIIGAFLAGFVVIPIVGAERSLILGMVANLIIGVVLLFFVTKIRLTIKVAAVASCAGVFLWSVSQPSIWDRLVLLCAQSERRTLEFGLGSGALPTYEQWRARLAREAEVLFWEDGACATVGVLGERGGIQKSLLTNGHVDASITDMDISVLVAAYPLIASKSVDDVAVVGWGSGVTLGTAALFPGAKVIGIEIEPAVLEAAKFFNSISFEPESNKAVSIEYNDGRNYLLATDQKFDAIISEPSNPWQAGVCNLFTQEFFHICKQRLKPDGVFTLWLQFGEVSTDNVRRVLAALKKEFKYALPLLATDEGTMVVLAGEKPLQIDYDKTAKVIGTDADSPLRIQLRRAGIRNVDDLISRIVTAPEEMQSWIADVQPNTDDRNRLEYEVGKTYENVLFLRDNERFIDGHASHPWSAVDWNGRSDKEKSSIMARVAELARAKRYPRRALAWANESMRLNPNPDALCVAGASMIALGQFSEGMKKFDEALAMAPDSSVARMTRGVYRLSTGDNSGARADFEAALRIQPGDKLLKYYLAQTYMSTNRKALPGTEAILLTAVQPRNDSQKALPLLLELINDTQFIQQHHDVLLLAGVALSDCNRPMDSIKVLNEYLKLSPRSNLGWRALGNAYQLSGNTMKAAGCWQRSFQLGQNVSAVLVVKAREHLDDGKPMEAIYALSKALEAYPENAKAYGTLVMLARSNPSARGVLDNLQVLQVSSPESRSDGRVADGSKLTKVSR